MSGLSHRPVRERYRDFDIVLIKTSVSVISVTAFAFKCVVMSSIVLIYKASSTLQTHIAVETIPIILKIILLFEMELL